MPAKTEKGRRAALKAWNTRRRKGSLIGLLNASLKMWEALLKFGPTDEDVEGAADKLMESFYEALYAWELQDSPRIAKKRSRK